MPRMPRMPRVYAILTGVLTTERTTMETPKAPGLDGVMAVGSPITAESAMGWYAAARWWGILADHEGGPAHQYAADDLAMACSDLVWTMQHRARFLSLFDSTL